MQYLIFSSFDAADARDAKGAEDKGNPDYGRLWGTIKDHASDKGALYVNSNFDYLTSEERDALVDELPEGWVIHPEIP